MELIYAKSINWINWIKISKYLGRWPQSELFHIRTLWSSSLWHSPLWSNNDEKKREFCLIFYRRWNKPKFNEDYRYIVQEPLIKFESTRTKSSGVIEIRKTASDNDNDNDNTQKSFFLWFSTSRAKNSFWCFGFGGDCNSSQSALK